MLKKNYDSNSAAFWELIFYEQFFFLEPVQWNV